MRDFNETFKHISSSIEKVDEAEIIKDSINFLYKNNKEKQYGENNLIIAIEELSELQQALTKWIRGMQEEENKLNIIEEIADVYLAIEYIKNIIGINSVDVNIAKKIKLQRIENKIKEDRFK